MVRQKEVCSYVDLKSTNSVNTVLQDNSQVYVFVWETIIVFILSNCIYNVFYTSCLNQIPDLSCGYEVMVEVNTIALHKF